MLSSAAVLVFCLIILVANYVDANKVTCKDEQGNNVDWFYMYKLPKHYTDKTANKDTTSDDNSDTSGLRYLFATSVNENKWQMSETKVNESDSLTAMTLNPLFSDATILLLAYNDEFPNGTTVATGGHAKGIVATDGTTGIWLIHSVPKFPTIPHYEYPATGAHYAQSALCLTLNVEEMEKVGQMLIYNEPNIYYERVPLMLDGKFPSLERVLNRQWRTAAPYENSVELVTLAGEEFKSFGKSGRADKELYADIVAPALNVNLLVETWRNGAGNLPANCAIDNKVYNIESINAHDLHIAFHTTNDHSKWAVSQSTGFKLFRWRFGGADWTCVGDINRQQHQLARGGGTVCRKNAKTAKLYRKLVESFDGCAP